ncbi:hypothetical protein AAVH_20872 [Aphelenchoides avenae]|nr:hypothetical protein AAVH_20872 [Aphelenchus avenae]
MFEDTSTNVHLVLVQGPPNSGKTHVLRQRYPAAYWKAPYTKDWHGYTSQTVAIVDNIIWPIPKVSTTTFAFEHLLQIVDQPGCILPHSSTFKMENAAIKTLILVGPRDWKEWFPRTTYDDVDIAMLNHRITEIWQFPLAGIPSSQNLPMRIFPVDPKAPSAGYDFDWMD